MEFKELASKFRSRMLWINLGAMAAVVFVLIMAAIFGMDLYTHHGERIEIPDVRKHSVENAEKVLGDLGLIVEVTDTGYVKTLPPGAILEQSPHPGSFVKSGRTVFLTINALDTPLLTLPDIIDNTSYREAKAKLTSMGFRLGETQFVTGEKDWLYGVKVKGRNISNGDRVYVDDIVVLVVGNGKIDNNDPDFMSDEPEPDYPELGDFSESDDFEAI